jgi:hypothetical protein
VHFDIFHSFFMISLWTLASAFVFLATIPRLFWLFLSTEEKEGAAFPVARVWWRQFKRRQHVRNLGPLCRCLRWRLWIALWWWHWGSRGLWDANGEATAEARRWLIANMWVWVDWNRSLSWFLRGKVDSVSKRMGHVARDLW